MRVMPNTPVLIDCGALRSPLRTGATLPHARPSLYHQVYAAEWFISLGLTMIWPLLLEHAGHYGVWKALSEVVRQQLMLKVLFTLFQVHSRTPLAIPCPCHNRAALMTIQAPSSDPRMGISFNLNLTS